VWREGGICVIGFKGDGRHCLGYPTSFGVERSNVKVRVKVSNTVWFRTL